MFWQGDVLIDNKNYVYACVFRQFGGYKILVWRNGYYIDFDSFKTSDEAKAYAEKAVSK